MIHLLIDPWLKKWLRQASHSFDDLPSYSQAALKKIKVRTNINKKISATNPLLIIANHPNVYDGFTVSSILKRDDVWIVSAALNQNISPILKKHILPVYFSNKPIRSILDFIRVPYWTAKEGGLTRAEAQKLNQEMIQKAAQLINSGEAVIIFPSGSSTNNNRWQNGVSYLLEQVDNPNARIIFIKIEGSKWYDFFRYSLLRKLMNYRKLNIKVSPEEQLAEYKKIELKNRTDFLKKKYESLFGRR